MTVGARASTRLLPPSTSRHGRVPSSHLSTQHGRTTEESAAKKERKEAGRTLWHAHELQLKPFVQEEAKQRSLLDMFPTKAIKAPTVIALESSSDIVDTPVTENEGSSSSAVLVDDSDSREVEVVPNEGAGLITVSICSHFITLDTQSSNLNYPYCRS